MGGEGPYQKGVRGVGGEQRTDATLAATIHRDGRGDRRPDGRAGDVGSTPGEQGRRSEFHRALGQSSICQSSTTVDIVRSTRPLIVQTCSVRTTAPGISRLRQLLSAHVAPWTAVADSWNFVASFGDSIETLNLVCLLGFSLLAVLLLVYRLRLTYVVYTWA